MTEDDIIRMAREAGPLTQGPFNEWCKRFAAIVAAHKTKGALAKAYRCGYEAGAAAEREACAKVCEDEEELQGHTPFDCALRIRARGNT